LPKLGNSTAEFEDAFACDDVTGRFALADGASESMFAGEWAQALCDEFIAGTLLGDDTGRWLRRAKRRWRKAVGVQPDEWHIQEKLREGAFATFLGIQIEASAECRWRAVAIGDSCLFLLRGDTLRKAFPIEHASDFNSRPDLIGTRQHAQVHASAIRGTLAAGDRLLLMTDALAQWFLTEHEAGASPAREMIALTEDGFAAWVDAKRKDRLLRNDDVTLLAIEIGDRGGKP
jgi:hypothetical protein